MMNCAKRLLSEFDLRVVVNFHKLMIIIHKKFQISLT